MPRVQGGVRGMWGVTVEQHAKPTGQTVHSGFRIINYGFVLRFGV